MGATLVEQGTQMMVILRSIATAAARTVQFHGRPHRVVPAVLVRAQILQNNMGRTFLPEDEITETWAEMWNGIPVLVGPHPSRGGQPMSGRNPDLLEARQAGFVFHAAADFGSDGVRRLTAEVWLDVERAPVVPGFQDVLDAVDAGQPVELSTGFNTAMDEITGLHNGQSYDIVLHPQGADHLVISTEMTGACSVRDGCGLGVNAEACGQCDRCAGAAGEMTMSEGTAGNDTPTQSVDGNPHPASHFAYVPDATKPSTWKLPIFDAAHVRAALARLNQTQIPAAAMPGVKRKIRAAAARFNIDAASLGNYKAPKWLGRLAEFLGASETMRDLMSYEDMVAANAARELSLQQLTPSDEERRQMLKEALQEKYGDNAREVVVCDVYTEPEKYVYFWFSTPMGPMPKGAEFLRAAWQDADGDGIPEIVAGEPVLVRRMTQYAPVGPGPAGDGAPAGAAAAAYQAAAVETKQEPAGNAAGETTETQVAPTATAAENIHEEDGAMAGNETKIEDVLAAINALGEQVKTIGEKVTQMEADGTTIGGLKKSITELTQKVGNVERLTAPAVEERERERRELVSSLAGNHKVPFSVAELESKPLAELRKLAEMAEGADYSGKGGPRGVENEQRFAATVPYTTPKTDEKK